MKTLPVLLMFLAASGLGLWLGRDYLRKARSAPVLVGMHLLLGAGGLEVFVVMLHGSPDGAAAPGGWMGRTAAGMLTVAAVAGLVAPMIGRRSRPAMSAALLAHVAVAGAGIALLVTWALRGAG